jgi:integral membrane protein
VNPALRTLRWASWAEGATLLLLMLVAVPLKRLADWPLGVSVMGPIHGAAFVGYGLMVMLHAGKGHLSARAVPLLMLAAFIPFGAWFVGSLFRTPDKT